MRFDKRYKGSFGVFTTTEKAEDIYQRWGHNRHCIKPEETIELVDKKISTCTQWGPDNIKAFIKQSNKLGMNIHLK